MFVLTGCAWNTSLSVMDTKTGVGFGYEKVNGVRSFKIHVDSEKIKEKVEK
jgi:hypothetical protein